VTENPISVQDDGFDVRLRRSGRNVAAPPGETILDALHDSGVNVSFAFTEGVAHLRNKSDRWDSDHRDTFLSEEEKAENSKIMICCWGSKSPLLTLDL
jgi:tetrachlorobenzoquinone reductase